MFRRKFLALIPAAGAAGYTFSSISGTPSVVLPDHKKKAGAIVADTREYWVSTISKIIDPVLVNLQEEQLKAMMPVECKKGKEEDRKTVTHLEAFGRVLAGVAPWLELGADGSPEGLIREKYILSVQKCLDVAVDPESSDYMNFTVGGQPLVDAAFMAHGLLRGYTRLWEPLSPKTKQRIVDALIHTRKIKPVYSNWLLFSAIIESFLLKAGYDWDPMRVDMAVKKHLEWYKGDGMYGDGQDFHWDYYNSFVIHPMMLDCIKVLVDQGKEDRSTYQLVLKRARRYAEIQERLISPEGTFPAIGRSLAYRFGAFQLLSQVSLMHELPENIVPSQVRSALSAVIHKMAEAEGTYDTKGWLTIGFCGHQPEIGEIYISTGSLYLCTTGLVALGLSPADPFWTSPATAWTQQKAWGGGAIPADHALHD